MKRVAPRAPWPASWRQSYEYDLHEIYDAPSNLGYAYAYRIRWAHILNLVRRTASPGGTILDIGAAQGNFSLALAEQGYEVTWNDLREDLAGYVKLKHERGTIHFAAGNLYELEFKSHFDVVLIAEVIEHVAHPDRFLRKISDMVRPGGHIVMTTPNGRYLRNGLPKFSECTNPELFQEVQFKPDSDGHIFLLHPDEIDPLARQAGLEVMEIQIFNNPLTGGQMKLGRLLKVVPFSAVQRVESLTGSLPAHLRAKLHTCMAVLFRRRN